MTREPHNPAGASAGELVARLLRATEVFEVEACNSGLREAFARLEPEALVREVLGPALRETGDRWHDGRISVVQEHLLSGAMRRHLFDALDRLNEAATGPRIVFTTLAGERHEMGTLMCGLIAAHRGFRALYLGPDLPVSEIGVFCGRVAVVAVALSIVTAPTVIDVPAQLAELRRHLPADVEIWVGGHAVEPLRAGDLPPRTVLMRDLDDFLRHLAGLGATAPRAPRGPTP